MWEDQVWCINNCWKIKKKNLSYLIFTKKLYTSEQFCKHLEKGTANTFSTDQLIRKGAEKELLNYLFAIQFVTKYCPITSIANKEKRRKKKWFQLQAIFFIFLHKIVLVHSEITNIATRTHGITELEYKDLSLAAWRACKLRGNCLIFCLHSTVTI